MNLQDILSQLDMKKRNVAIRFYHEEYSLVLIFYLIPKNKLWNNNINNNTDLEEYFSDSNAYFYNIKNYEHRIQYFSVAFNSYDFYKKLDLELGDTKVDITKVDKIISTSTNSEIVNVGDDW